MLKSKYRARSAVFAATLVSLIAWGATPAIAAGDQPDAPPPPITLTSEQRSNILGEFEKFDVDPAQGLELIDKLESGEAWDSSTEAEPVSVEPEAVDGFDFTVSRFADGSFVAAGIAQPVPADANARAIQNCSSSGTSAGVSYRTNCTIIVTNGATSGQFKASYSYWASGSSISNVSSGVINSDIGSATATGFTSSTAPGTKWTQFNWTTFIDGAYSASRYVRLTVSTGGGTSSASY
ncbi:hypothetical protein [Rathayibacter sp. SD072]|uniref:hypothetical protein n=1 Tax=Rathayibacter sp. SD072 TaxID=2781731 RepID=UPI001A95F03F|nr:hypothetical protein [Rathayibacter sp. SD072]MBO0982691.1 hypothetical protein [Rathayibacter sp. SD072]